MQLIQFWLVAAIVPPVALLLWWAMRTTHGKRLAAVQARHLKAQQSAAALLQQSRKQIAQLQQELAAARLAATRPTRVERPRSTVSPAARDCLMKILDEAPQAARALPVDGFAETMPLPQFPHASAFGHLSL
jgi:soluble lytic murein transglycosylase-like protein